MIDLVSEKEKMLNGQWHDANFDKNLLEERRKAELLCYDFNMTKPGSIEQKTALTNLLVSHKYTYVPSS